MRLVSKIPLLVMTLIASGCMSGDLGEMFKGAPPIVADVSESSTVPNAEFTAHLRERYPIGSEEAVLIATLREQHFNFPQPGKATYHWSTIACSISVYVDWRAEAGRLTGIEGVYGSACM
ncbi:MAG: hypothetical protein WDM79_12185 [Terricaulis sp.]